jgi:hypothetical protein
LGERRVRNAEVTSSSLVSSTNLRLLALPLGASFGWQATRRLSTIARSAKVDHDQLRAIRRRLREGHQKLFDLHGEQIAGLQEALTALSRSHDEMVALMQADNDLEDLTDTHGLT